MAFFAKAAGIRSGALVNYHAFTSQLGDRMNISEFEDAYEDVQNIGDTILATPVSELMSHNPLVVDADTSVVSAVNAMNEHHIGCVLVQKDGKLIGIFTERDALRRLIFRDGNRSWPVEAVMTRNPSTLPPSASVAFALNRMSLDGYRHIPIVDHDGKAIGVISIKDIVKLVVEAFPEGVLNLPPNPDHACPRTADGA
jgi:CBS domain-containing protein